MGHGVGHDVSDVMVRQPVGHLAASRGADDHSSGTQDPEVLRNEGLSDAEFVDEFVDAALAGLQLGDDGHPEGVGQRPQQLGSGVEASGTWCHIAMFACIVRSVNSSPPPTGSPHRLESAEPPKRSAAATTQTQEVEPVMDPLKADLVGNCGQGRVHRPLDADGQYEVFDRSTTSAQEMVMVLGEVLGQLVPGELVGGGHPTHDSRLLEHRQVAVHRALGQTIVLRQDFGEGQGTIRIAQDLDEGMTVPRVALAFEAQTLGGDLVEVGAHGTEP